MARAIGIGNQDFEKIRQEGYFYIDKTRFIQDWWDTGDSVTKEIQTFGFYSLSKPK